ncbi:hypothetical protein NCCP2331_00110 [Sporosarcina sp. NCCP-2331]|nr:hypothetical protein NCCP2331_00110 [Sporosarcina sp. NCCP-2331]GLB54637.1 hypothetical protein NCCP2378_04220 [Sporosarcina sp. NCCP-2378]
MIIHSGRMLIETAAALIAGMYVIIASRCMLIQQPAVIITTSRALIAPQKPRLPHR